MANPSSKYASTEKTSSNFTYKETNDNIATLFPLNSNIDLSIAYSSNNIADYTKYSMACWSANAHSWYVAQNVYADIPWDYSSSSHRHSYIKNVSVAKDWASNLSCKLYNIFLTNNSQNREFTFGYNSSASSTAGSFTSKIISDFDVNKVVFTASLTGLTKTEWNTFLADNTTTSNHSISLSDFLANPSDYMISDFQVKSLATWNSGTDKWSANELIYPTAMIDSEQMRSIVGYKVLFYTNLHMGCTSDYAGANLYCDNLTVYTNAYQYGTMTNEINATDGFILGSGLDNLSVIPQVPSEDLIDKATNGITGTFSTPWKKFDIGNNFIDMYESDTYTYAADPYPVGASTSHPNAYKKHFRQMIKGDKVSECLAQIGIYFWTDTVSELNNNSTCTPDTMGDSSKMYLGVMAASGITNGTWIHGNDINNYTGPNKSGSIVHPDYNPSGGGGSQDDDPWHGVDFGGSSGGGGAFAKFYYMTSTELANLRSWMNSNNVPEGFDPMAQIIGLSQLPVAISGSAPENVMFVNSSAIYTEGQNRVVDTGVATQRGLGRTIVFNLGSVEIPRRMQQRGEPYLDYSCAVELYLPFCGVFSLDTQAVMGRTITAQLVLDPTSGSVIAYAWVSESGQKLPVAYGSGQVGVDLPVTAQQYSMSKAALTQANSQLYSSFLNGAMALIQGIGGNASAMNSAYTSAASKSAKFGGSAAQ